MKKFLLSLLGVLTMLPASALDFDYTYQGQTLKYTVTDEEVKTVSVSGHYQPVEIVIPSVVEYEGEEYSVTSIGSNAFSDCYGLTSIELPSSITSIGGWAFAYCRNLTSIELPASVTSIGEFAFYDCWSLMKSTYPSTISNPFTNGVAISYDPDSTIIEDGIIYGKNKETIYYAPYSLEGEFEIPNSVTSIGEYAFANCSGLTSIELPTSVTSIGGWAFANCSGLTSIELPASITSIGASAFTCCQGLTSMELPASITSIGADAFYGCSSLTSIELPASVTSIGSQAFAYCSGLTSIELPASVNSIGWSAFAKCSHLTSMQLPASVTSIEPQTFEGCSSLTSIELPASITSIGADAFYGCSSLTSIELPASITSIGEAAFASCSSLTSMELPASVNSIGASAFQGCSGLTSIELPASVISIGGYAFQGCSGLTSIELPASVISIGLRAFANCSRLTSMQLPVSVTSIGSDAFYGCSRLIKSAYPSTISNPFTNGVAISYDPDSAIIEDGIIYGKNKETIYYAPCSLEGAFEIPNSVTSIGESALAGCKDLSSVIIPSSVTSIGEKAFEGCNNLKLLVCSKDLDLAEAGISESVKIMRFDSPFIIRDGMVLTDDAQTLLYAPLQDGDNYIIPDGVRTIKTGALDVGDGYWMTTLESITIPASLEVIEADVFKNIDISRVIFKDWEAWHSNATLGNLESNPYRNGAEIYAGDIRISSVPELKEGQTEIKDYINYGLEGYRDEVELPTTLKRIGAYAFYDNKELYSVFLNNGLEEIGEHAFKGCELLENQAFPSSLNKIEESAYRNCISLTEVIIPANLTSLGAHVFEGCTGLERAELVADIDYIPDCAFTGCSSLNKLYLPLQLKSIGDYAFADCTAMDEITFPSSLENIGEYAFYASSFRGKISRLDIPNRVTNIGKYAFHRQSIRNLTIGKGLEIIPESAFEDNFLKSVTFSEGLKKIERNAFARTDRPEGGIASVVLPSTMTEIEENAFYDTEIQELVIPDGIISLPAGSCGIPALLTVGNDVKEINANAFSFENLITFRLKTTMPPTLNEAFPLTNEQNDQLTLVVNQGRRDRYTTNARWKQIENIIEEESTDVTVYLDGTYTLAEEIRMQSGLMPSRVNKLKVVGPLSNDDLRMMRENMVSLRKIDLEEVSNITEIPAGQFSNSLLSEIIFPTNLESIGWDAFSNCRLLQLSTLPETIQEIGDRAFANCPGITITEIPEPVYVLGESAFENCTGIREIKFGSKLGHPFNGDAGINPVYLNIPPRLFSGCTLLERVDLSQSSISIICEEAFKDCYELDEVLLPETTTYIEGRAFSNTALRDLSFLPVGVESLGIGIFSDCRRLVTATVPEKVSYIWKETFSNCPRLLTISLPTGTKTVEANVVNNDKKLSNISCAATEAPNAVAGAFDNIRIRYVSLTIPTLSFRSYLSAPQWGKFETILNRLRIPVKIEDGIDVSHVAEDDYQEMLREDELEAAQEAAAQETDPENIVQLQRRAARRSAARINTYNTFAALFDGAQIQCADGSSGTRVFINPQEGVKVTSIKLNGEEIMDQMEGNSLLLPATSDGELEILTDNHNTDTRVEEIVYDEMSAPIYTLTGTMVGRGRADLEHLQPGIYIFCGRKIAVK